MIGFFFSKTILNSEIRSMSVCLCTCPDFFFVIIPDHHQSVLCSLMHQIYNAESMSKLTIIGMYIRSTQMKWIMLFHLHLHRDEHNNYTSVLNQNVNFRSTENTFTYFALLCIHAKDNRAQYTYQSHTHISDWWRKTRTGVHWRGKQMVQNHKEKHWDFRHVSRWRKK